MIANRPRTWSKELQVLEENQSGFRPGRSTADASQIYPEKNMVEMHNSETQTARLSLSLFADDTTPIGEKKEIESGTATIK